MAVRAKAKPSVSRDYRGSSSREALDSRDYPSMTRVMS